MPSGIDKIRGLWHIIYCKSEYGRRRAARKTLAYRRRVWYNHSKRFDAHENMYGDVQASTARGLRRKAGGRVGYLKTQKALIANKKENAKVMKFAAPAAPAMALAA